MNDVRIVCTHDALKVAQTLERLLAALEYNVDIYYGRASAHVLEKAREKREAVLLIWSRDAQSASYMHDWAMQIDPTRLVEISRAKGAWPVEGRKAPVIDFHSWSGERGGPAWRALMERLKNVARMLEPAKPPPMRAAIALGAASALAVGGALVVRIDDALTPVAPMQTQTAEAATIEVFGRGGAASAIEPASGDFSIQFSVRRVAMIEAPAVIPLEPMPGPADLEELRDPTVMERISSLARPFFRGSGDEPGSSNGDNDSAIR